MSDGYDLEPQDDVVAAPVAAPSQPAANATWTLTDLRQGSSNWSLASDSGVRLFRLYSCTSACSQRIHKDIEEIH